MKSLNEKYFFNYFDKITKSDAQYLNLPNEISFNTCLDECIKYCKKKQEMQKSRKTQEFHDFYDFLLRDKILQTINSSEYLNLLEKISMAMNNTISLEYMEIYLKKIRFLFGKKHYLSLIEELKKTIHEDNSDFKKIENLTMQFVNELIFSRVTYRYITLIYYHDYYKGKKFEDVYKFIDYLSLEENENIEIYLPLKNFEERDINFLESQDQTIVEKNDENNNKTYYCKVYSNSIDYVEICKDNMIRIESIFNLHKFYRKSQINFDYSKNVYIERKNILKDSFDIKFTNLISYTYFVGKQEIIDLVVKNINKMKDSNNGLFYYINNILSYAEKDNDLLTVGSYVDNWIALETLIKLSDYKKGFEGVLYYIPRSLAISYYRKTLNETLKKGRKKYTLDEFFGSIFNNPYSFEKNFFHSDRTFMLEENQNVTDFNLLSERIKSIQDYLERDLYRIYNLRNEYVHSSNIKAHVGIKQHKLKRIFSDFFDLFMKSLNSYLKDDYTSVTGKDVLSDLAKKFENRDLVLKLMSNKLKINGNNISKKNIYSNLEPNQIVANIIFDRILILNQNFYDDED